MQYPYIIQENNVDGCNTYIKIPVYFSRKLSADEQRELSQILTDHRQVYIDNGEYFDTDDVVEESLQEFCQKHQIAYQYANIPRIEF